MRLKGIRYLTGAALAPLSAFLILRGSKTLELRMAQHSRTGLAVAEVLSAHPAVATVHYPKSAASGHLAPDDMNLGEIREARAK